jgi:hypothetical protein
MGADAPFRNGQTSWQPFTWHWHERQEHIVSSGYRQSSDSSLHAEYPVGADAGQAAGSELQYAGGALISHLPLLHEPLGRHEGCGESPHVHVAAS